MIGALLDGRYELVEEAGQDPVFYNFRGVDKKSDSEVFARVVKPAIASNPQFFSELSRVIEDNQTVASNGLERFISCRSDASHSYVVSEYTAGTTLRDRLKRLASLSVPVAVGMGIEICEALESLHSAGIVHGDVSSRTIIATPTDGVKVVQAGFWKAYGQDGAAAVGVLKEMAPYLAPEVTAGGMPTTLSDIYALGVVMWQMLAGRVPFPGNNPVEVATRHSSGDYPSLRAISGSIPVALDEIIRKCLDKNPLHRYANVGKLMSDLRMVQDALRFGRKLTWPLAGGESVLANPEVAPALNIANPQNTTAQMDSGKKGKPAKPAKERAPRDEDGIPTWLAAIIYIVTALFILVAGSWVFFNSAKPKTLEVPTLVGTQVEDAKKELKSMGLKLRIPKNVENEKFPEGAIIETEPSAGEAIKQGMYVEATVSKGSKYVEVPDLRGRSIDEAKKLVASMRLTLGDEDIELVRDKELEEGLVVSQVPEAGKKVERNTRIKMKVSNGDKRVRRQNTDDAWHTHKIAFDVTGVDQDTMVRVDVTDSRGTRNLFEQLMSPNDKVDETVRWTGDELIVRTFYDGELVDQQAIRPAENGG